MYGNTVPHLKRLRYGKDESRELSCECTSSICQDVMKSDNLLNKQGFGDSLLQTTVPYLIFFQSSLLNILPKKPNLLVSFIKCQAAMSLISGMLSRYLHR